MKPFSIAWPEISAVTSVVALNATATQNVALPFTTRRYEATPDSLQPVPVYMSPSGIVRNIQITTVSGSIAGVNFVVTGYNIRDELVTETIIGTAGGTIYYKMITSIIPTSAVTAVVNVGLGDEGSTILCPMDTYNKTCSFTIAYKVFGTVSLTPYYTINQIVQFVGTEQVIIPSLNDDPFAYFILPVDDVNFINSPDGISAMPIISSSAYSFVGIPLTGIQTQVTSTTGSFIQTIMQQGAAY
jgi:hypothetical protein